MARLQLLCVLLACALAFCGGYYVPGTYPKEFGLGDTIEVLANSLTSTETELPFDYYSLPFCKPSKGVRRVSESSNLGTILQGVRIHNSPYNFSVKVEEKNKVLCPRGYAPPLKPKHVKRIRRMINQEYVVNLVLDNLPVVNYDLKREKGGYVRPGFLLGERRGKKYYINNHLVFTVLVHQSHGEYRNAREGMSAAAMESLDVRKLLTTKDVRKLLASKDDKKPKGNDEAAAPAPAGAGGALPIGPQPELYMIVGFEVQPCSIAREAGKPVDVVACDGTQDMQEVKVGDSIVYTYDVYWEISKHKWASRWDAYLKMPGGKQVHWFSIVNSILVILVMAVICALILIRTIRRDLTQYEQLVVDSNSLDLKEEAGWKLVAGDVFRAPADALGLSVQVGAGVQIIATFSVTLFLATLGFLSPASRGALVTTLMIMYVLLAIPAGAAAAYTHALMDRTFTAWSAVAWRTSLYFSGTIFGLFTILNLVIHHTGSSGAVPFTIYLTLVLIWFLVTVPLTFFGAYSATKLPLIDWPVKTNQIPRHVPEAPVAAHPYLLMAAAGILPFGALFIELYFIMTSVWLGFFFYLFGFVFLIGMLTIIICSEIAILTTYVQLCAEDYLWWWRSFHRGGSVAIYIGLHSLAFLFTTLKQLSGFVPVFIYLTYMSMAVFAIYLALGTVGFGASLWFVYTIFKAVKQD